MNKWLFFVVLSVAGLLSVPSVTAQKYPERSSIRSGNRSYGKYEYQQAEVAYRRALDKQPASFEAAYNLSNALFKQQNYEEAGHILDRIKADSMAGQHAPAVHYNRGNTHLAQEEIEQAIESYKEALRRDPQDMQAKFNLAYAQKMLQDPPANDQDQNADGEDGGEGDGGEENDDQDDRSDEDPSENNEDKDERDQDPEDETSDPDRDNDTDERELGDGNERSDSEGDDSRQNGKGNDPGRMSREQAEQLLNAMQGAEDNTRQKVDGQKVPAVGRSGKNW